jgi:hypothetical protein
MDRLPLGKLRRESQSCRHPELFSSNQLTNLLIREGEELGNDFADAPMSVSIGSHSS